MDEMCATLGGRAAEEVFMNQNSTGAINDLERVTKRAYAMVAYFGMSEKLPNMSYYDSTGNSDYGFTKPYSERTAEIIDEEARDIVADQYKRAKKILSDNAEGHNKLAELLIEREVIFAEDLEKVFGKRAWISRNDELMAQNGGTDILDDAPEVKAIEATEVAPAVDNTVLVEDNTTTTEENKSDK
jgi:cell division protease FtsH